MVMERDDGEAHASAGQDCPAQKPIGATNEITINGERLRIVQATDEEGAAITQYLKERAESAPAGARIGRASALVRSGSRVAAIVLLAVGVGVGLGDGNVFDDVGCSVAQQPRRASHDADSGQAGEHRNGTDQDGGLTIEDGRERRAECVARAEMCVNRQPDGRCRTTMQPCRLFVGVDDIRAMMAEVRAGVVGLAMGPPVAATEPVSEDEARRLFALLRALELESNFRKAPVTRVFMLYCLDGKSRDAVARDCNCSPSLITLRLQAIERKLGRKPAELRQFSDHFERIADSLSDSRARRIDRRRAIDGSEPDWPSEPDNEV
jgi:hypothetical protein